MKKLCILLITLYASTVSAKPPKLPNYGQTCYLNATLQALYAVKPFINLLENKTNLYKDPFAKAYADLISNFAYADSTKLSLETDYSMMYGKQFVDDLIANYKIAYLKKYQSGYEKATKKQQEQWYQELKIGPDISRLHFFALLNDEVMRTMEHPKDPTCGAMAQRDSQEFLNKLIADALLEERSFRTYSETEKALVSKTEKALVAQLKTLISYEEESILKCPTSGYKSSKTEFAPFLRLSVPKEPESLNQRINQYFTLETGVPYEGETDCTKQPVMTASPEILIIQLKRYDAAGTKINIPVAIPEYLNMSSITHREDWYHLISVVVHAGPTITSGHYTSYVQENNQWYFCDDDNISQTTFAEVSAQILTSGYMFFYQKLPEPPAHIQQLDQALNEFARRLDQLARAISTPPGAIDITKGKLNLEDFKGTELEITIAALEKAINQGVQNITDEILFDILLKNIETVRNFIGGQQLYKGLEAALRQEQQRRTQPEPEFVPPTAPEVVHFNPQDKKIPGLTDFWIQEVQKTQKLFNDNEDMLNDPKNRLLPLRNEYQNRRIYHLRSIQQMNGWLCGFFVLFNMDIIHKNFDSIVKQRITAVSDFIDKLFPRNEYNYPAFQAFYKEQYGIAYTGKNPQATDPFTGLKTITGDLEAPFEPNFLDNTDLQRVARNLGINNVHVIGRFPAGTFVVDQNFGPRNEAIKFLNTIKTQLPHNQPWVVYFPCQALGDHFILIAVLNTTGDQGDEFMIVMDSQNNEIPVLADPFVEIIAEAFGMPKRKPS